MDKHDEILDYILSPEIIKSTTLLMRSSFEAYLKFMFLIVNEHEVMFGPFHRELCVKLEDIVFSRNTKRNLAINVPVGSGKSLIIEYFITWCFARTVNQTFLYTSYSANLIAKLSREAKEIVTHEKWIVLFGNVLKKDQRSAINWSFEGSKNRTGLTAGSTGGSLTGLDAGNPNVKGFSGALIIDDPIDASKVRYSTARKEVVDFYDNKLSTRRRTPTTPTILLMQRLHKEDLTGWLMDKEPEDWDILKIPAMNEDNTSFWESRYPIEELKKIARINPYKFNSQYQQNPISSGGNVIKTEWIKFYDKIPEFRRVFITGDTAQKKQDHNDYSVFIVWGVTDSQLLKLEMVRGKWESPELLVVLKDLINRWKTYQNKHLTGVYIEDKVSGTYLIQHLQREIMVPIIALQRNNDKLTRVEDVLPFIESGRLLLPYSKTHGTNPETIGECESFTRDDSHAFDDIVDNICDGIQVAFLENASILDAL